MDMGLLSDQKGAIEMFEVPHHVQTILLEPESKTQTLMEI